MICNNIEIWKDIPGYEGYYQASTFGNIRSVDRIIAVNRKGISYNLHIKGKLLVPVVHWDNRVVVSLAKGGKKIINIGRLVALTFIPNPHNFPEINHKDENPRNNCVWNIEWCEKYYNLLYGTRIERCSKGKWKKVKQYDKNTGVLINTYDSLKSVEEAGVCKAKLVSACCRGKSKTAGGYIWCYAD